MNIIVDPVFVPPTLTVNGKITTTLVTVLRGTTAVFNLVVGDINSNNGTLYLFKNNFPFGTGSWSTVEFVDLEYLTATNINSSTTFLTSVDFLVHKVSLFPGLHQQQFRMHNQHHFRYRHRILKASSVQ